MPAADIERLARNAADCRACDLWRDATQTVFGEGPAGAKLMLVGEQPGDREDLAGRPFVGPAGRVLTKRSLQPASNATTSTSRMRSSTSSGRPAASAASTTSPTARRSTRAVNGSTPSSRRSGRVCSSCSGQPPRRLCSAARSESRASAAERSPGRGWPTTLSRRFIHPQSSASGTARSVNRRSGALRTTFVPPRISSASRRVSPSAAHGTSGI